MAGGVGQVAEWLPTKHKDPSSNPSIAKSKSSAILLLEVRTSSLHQFKYEKHSHHVGWKNGHPRFILQSLVMLKGIIYTY